MIILDESHLLFIEPKGPASQSPVEDELTATMRAAFATATIPEEFTLGYHECVCGARSTGNFYFLENGLETNSLAVHYLQFHRDEVPASELMKVKNIGKSLQEICAESLEDLGSEAEVSQLKRPDYYLIGDTVDLSSEEQA
jgi:hypothetical protein